MGILVPHRRRGCIRRGWSADCEAVRLDGFVRVSDRILDLSHHGARLTADGLVREGDELDMTLRAPRSLEWIDAIAEVRRVDRDGTFGVRFTELEWDARASLFVELAGVPPRLPVRRIRPDYAATVRRIAADQPRPRHMFSSVIHSTRLPTNMHG